LVVNCADPVAIAGPVVVQGGPGGGCHNCNPCVVGPDGAAVTGKVILLQPPFPVLDTSGDLVPGGLLDIAVTGEPGASALLLISNRRGWVRLPGVYGAPWTALAGDLFLIFAIGRVPVTGELLVGPLPLPDDPALQGFALSTQAVLLGGTHAMALSNGSTRVVGE
jgi:hypothetical protein